PTDSVDITVRQPSGGAADLAIAKSGPATVLAGERITYTLVVTNYGPADANDVQVADALPAGVSFVAALPSQGLCEAGVSCQLGAMDLDATATITVVGLVASATQTGTLLANIARVDAANGDPNAANNTASATTAVETSADLSINKVATPNPAIPGAVLTYQIVVTNSGPSDAPNVVVTDTLPADFTVTNVASSQGGCTALPCTLGTLPAGGVASITVSGVLAASATASQVNSAGVSSATPDPVPGDNVVEITTAVAPSADLVLDLVSTPTTIAGTTAIVTATVTNLGLSDAQGAVVTITLPSGTSYASANLPAGWSVASSAGDTVVLTTTDPLAADASVDLP
ncbi:MAG: DUF11 domain-containing protein, partial [Caldilineaceae bacterium]|nr:DUF11 domain-containing protein [Caldilineaceae bacterium]